MTSLPRSQFYYKSRKDDSDVIEALQDLAFHLPTYGFLKLFAYLRRAGNSWSQEGVQDLQAAEVEQKKKR